MRVVNTSIVLGAVLVALGSPAGAADNGGKAAAKPAAAAEVKAGAKPAGKAPAAATTAVVAKVNGVGIPQAEFDRNWEYFLQRSGIPAEHADKEGSVSEFRKQVLDRLVDEELLYQEAKSRKRLAGKDVVDA